MSLVVFQQEHGPVFKTFEWSTTSLDVRIKSPSGNSNSILRDRRENWDDDDFGEFSVSKLSHAAKVKTHQSYLLICYIIYLLIKHDNLLRNTHDEDLNHFLWSDSTLRGGGFRVEETRCKIQGHKWEQITRRWRWWCSISSVFFQEVDHPDDHRRGGTRTTQTLKKIKWDQDIILRHQRVLVIMAE